MQLERQAIGDVDDERGEQRPGDAGDGRVQRPLVRVHDSAVRRRDRIFLGRKENAEERPGGSDEDGQPGQPRQSM